MIILNELTKLLYRISISNYNFTSLLQLLTNLPHTKPKLTNLQSVNVIKKTLGKKLTTNLPKLTNTTRLGG